MFIKSKTAMKKYIFSLLAAALLLLSGCSKERRCQCVNVDNENVVTYVNADAGFRCSSITRLGFERLIEGKLIREMEEVTCTEAKD